MRATQLTVGRVRGLQQLADERGLFTILGLDQRSSLRAMLGPTAPAAVPYDALVGVKLLLTRILAPRASAVLLDPVYGAAQAVGQGVLPGSTGLIVSLESSGYDGVATAPHTALVRGFGVRKAKLMGASACKLLLHYRPDSPTAGAQEGLAAEVGEACRVHDMPLLLAPLSFSIRPQTAPKGSSAFALERPRLVLESVGRLAPLGADLLAAEFPADLQYDSPEQALATCRRLSEAVAMPWVVYSVGAEFDLFRHQVEIACRGGASGFVAGRALWQEMARLPQEQWEEFAAVTATRRLETLVQIAHAQGRPYRPTVPVPADWPDSYGLALEPAPAALVD